MELYSLIKLIEYITLQLFGVQIYFFYWYYIMHKSGMFTFGLLLSSLVMISAMPLCQQQFVSKVMAQDTTL